MNNSIYNEIINYHEETKHDFHRFSRSSGFMDWQNQPDPFRTYEGAEMINLPLIKQDSDLDYIRLYTINNKSEEFNLKNTGAFLELSLGLSAWKSVPGSTWSLRINPSSGNLHPTESHLIIPETKDIKGGIYHYNPFYHALELRGAMSEELSGKIINHFKTEGFLIGISSIFWREAWKYGERAFRYCNHDTGHALASLSFSAHLLGWTVKYLNSLSSEDIETLLGFDRVEWKKLEEEYGELLCYVYPASVKTIPLNLSDEIIKEFSKIKFYGKPNILSEENVNWQIIYKTAENIRKKRTDERIYDYGNKPFLIKVKSSFKAPEIIRQRRSAVDFERESSFIRKDQFFSILDKTLPRNDVKPFDVKIFESSVHLLLFIHNVEELKKGLYFFIRNSKDLPEIKSLSNKIFLWKEVKEGFPLYLLMDGDFREEAKLVSCTQDIAGESAFSLGMIAKFKEVIKKEPFRYSHLLWETGMIGQVLYLEAEACGLRGTGIGCFFDDPVHKIMGFGDNSYQSLYHFTVGKSVEDKRLKTKPPYFHLKKLRNE